VTLMTNAKQPEKKKQLLTKLKARKKKKARIDKMRSNIKQRALNLPWEKEGSRIRQMLTQKRGGRESLLTDRAQEKAKKKKWGKKNDSSSGLLVLGRHSGKNLDGARSNSDQMLTPLYKKNSKKVGRKREKRAKIRRREGGQPHPRLGVRRF